MPLDRSITEALASDIVLLYEGLQTRMAKAIADRLSKGIESSSWEQRKYAEVGALRDAAVRMIAELNSGSAAEEALIKAYITGQREALKDMGAPHVPASAFITQLPAIAALLRALLIDLQGSHVRLLRWNTDVYRRIVAESVLTGTLLGHETRLQTAQRVWERALSHGVTGFTDKAGRNWELASYVEMAVRTTTAHAAIEGHVDRLQESGIDLIITSDAPQECERCRPWEGKILSRAVPGKREVTLQHTTQDREITITIAGSLPEAIAAGFMHPNCRHSITGYVPGITKMPAHTADPEGDKNRRKLRSLERKLRSAKLLEVAVIDPSSSPRHRAKVKAVQAQIREHVAATGLHRQRHRERIGAAR
jgi:hypothetical protein